MGLDATRICLLRHGQTAWNAEQRLQGQLDIPLDDTGLWQADRLAEALAGEHFDALHCSDLQRARQTAAPLAAATGLPLQLNARLRERSFGRFEGMTYAEVEAQHPEDSARWRAREPDFAPGGGETLNAFSARCVAALAELAAQHPGQHIAVVAHGGVLDCLYRAATHLTLSAPRSWQLANATVNRLLWTADGPTLVGWNDARHLEGFSPPALRPEV